MQTAIKTTTDQETQRDKVLREKKWLSWLIRIWDKEGKMPSPIALKRRWPDEYKQIFTELEAVAKVQSIKSSNAIEGIVTSDERIAAIVNQNSAPLNHNEAEIAGYRDALNEIHLGFEHIDFRNRDIAAGGQGAPLVPAFHASVFASDEPRAIVNFGGIANVTFLGRREDQEKTFGFDCGPANILLDAWVKDNLGLTYDKDAKWARAGVLNEDWLSCLYSSEPYFSQSCPKSTGRELFNLEWLNKHLRAGMKPEDVQHTLTALSALAVAKDIEKYQPETQEVFTCGGGAKNPLLMEYLQKYLPGKIVQPTDILGLGTQDVEGAAFAWLAKQFVERLPGNLPAVTGAKGKRILGALYPH